VKNLAEVNTSDGTVNIAYAHAASGQVEAMLYTHGHVLVGGYFTALNGTNRGFLASTNPATGAVDGYVNLNISGNYVYTDDGGKTAVANPTRVYNFGLSPAGDRLLVMGDFTSVGGQGRRQIFVLDLGSTAATLDSWYSPEFSANCATVEPYYVKDATWSPDGTKIYTATNGYKPANGLGYRTSDPRAGLCDAAAAFSSVSSGNQAHLWVNYTGCDSLYAVAADANNVYIGGHERWANNGLGCDNAGSGAVSRPGLGGLSASTGSATTWNPTRARGRGADDALVTTAGLWIASDTTFSSTQCGGEYHPGICFLPY
jgi:hypothetical protein